MRLTIIALMLVTGCAAATAEDSLPERVQPGMYMTYRTMFQGNIFKSTRDKDHAQCAGDFLMANVSSADMAQLDRYARGEITLSQADFARIDQMVTAKFRSKPGNEALRPYCPDKVDTFRLPN